VDLPFLNRLDLHEGWVVDKSKKCISFLNFFAFPRL
jgi:hypothetical protein